MRPSAKLRAIGDRFGVRRPGSPADVEDLRTAWQRLLDLGPGGPEACGHDYECPEFTERHAALDDALDRVSWRQQRRVERHLTHHSNPPGILDPLIERVSRRRGDRS